MKWRPCWCTKAILAACSLHSQRDRYGEQSFGRGAVKPSSSETQGEIVVARESLNRWKNMVRRKVKNSEKSPWGQCLTRPVPNGHRHSAFWLCRKTQTLSPFFTFLCAIFFRPFSFPRPHYLPPGSPMMQSHVGNQERRETLTCTKTIPPARQAKLTWRTLF